MNWPACLDLLCIGALLGVSIYLVLTEPKCNRRVRGSLPPPSSDCRRNYVP